MARLVKIPGISYETFARIRNVYLVHAPWAIRNDIYDKASRTGFLFFEDSQYISWALSPFIVSPPLDLTAIDEDLKPIQKTLGWQDENHEKRTK